MLFRQLVSGHQCYRMAVCVGMLALVTNCGTPRSTPHVTPAASDLGGQSNDHLPPQTDRDNPGATPKTEESSADADKEAGDNYSSSPFDTEDDDDSAAEGINADSDENVLALDGDQNKGKPPILHMGDSIQVNEPAQPPPDAPKSSEVTLTIPQKTAATSNEVIIYDKSVGKPFGFEQQVRNVCVGHFETCTGWKTTCSRWIKALGAKTCRGWTMHCVKRLKTCSQWRVDTRSLHHAPRVIVKYSGKNIEGIKRDIEKAVTVAAGNGLAVGYVSGGAAAYQSFIVSLRLQLSEYDLGKLSISVKDKTEWSKWSNERKKTKPQRPKNTAKK